MSESSGRKEHIIRRNINDSQERVEAVKLRAKELSFWDEATDMRTISPEAMVESLIAFIESDPKAVTGLTIDFMLHTAGPDTDANTHNNTFKVGVRTTHASNTWKWFVMIVDYETSKEAIDAYQKAASTDEGYDSIFRVLGITKYVDVIPVVWNRTLELCPQMIERAKLNRLIERESPPYINDSCFMAYIVTDSVYGYSR